MIASGVVWQIMFMLIAGVLIYLFVCPPELHSKKSRKKVKIHRMWVDGKETDKQSVKKRLEDML